MTKSFIQLVNKVRAPEHNSPLIKAQSDELKNCPFCCKRKLRFVGHYRNVFIECGHCEARGPKSVNWSWAKRKWNNQAVTIGMPTDRQPSYKVFTDPYMERGTTRKAARPFVRPIVNEAAKKAMREALDKAAVHMKRVLKNRHGVL